MRARIDRWTWRNIPSVVGYQILGVEGELVSTPLVGQLGGDLTAVFNWRSGEIGLLGGYSGKAGLGAGEKGSISLTGGPVATWGASSLKPLTEGDYQGSLSGGIAAGPNVGLSLDVSLSADGFDLEVDPVSGMPVTTVALQGSAGLGAGADVAVTGGIPYTNYSWLLSSKELY
jgi:hypothetical protein